MNGQIAIELVTVLEELFAHGLDLIALAKQGTLDPATVLARIQTMRDQLLADDVAANAETVKLPPG